MLENHRIVPKEDWLAARKQFLVKEKEFTRLRDQISQERRELPWFKIEKPYEFNGPDGIETLADLFAGKSQLIVYHFMFGPDWEAGCKSCSFWADNFNGIDSHLRHRDTSFVAISRAAYSKLEAYKDRMGWDFKWVSSFGNGFNYDFHVSFTDGQMASEAYYNYELRKPWGSEAVGISVFYKDDEGNIFHTYSCYSRGVDMMNGAYHYLDLTPQGRNEDIQVGGNPQAWVRRHDEYED